jgi:hypothetical protein
MLYIVKEKKYMKNSVIVIQSVVITALFSLIVIFFFEMDSAIWAEENFDNDKTISSQQVIEAQCKSPCPPNAEMYIEMCA